MSVVTESIRSLSSGLFTCMTCRVGFHDGELQRDHYKSDWHRYNLKRKVVNLPPVTVENFNERVEEQRIQELGLTQDTSQYCTLCKKSFGNEKAFTNHLSSKKHVQLVIASTVEGDEEEETGGEIAEISEKVKDVEIAKTATATGGKKIPPTPAPVIAKKGKGGKEVSTPMEVEDDEDEDEWEEVEGDPIPVTTCLFCSKESKNVEANLSHMSRNHGFFIPDVEYCTDLEGFLEYLGEKVGEGMMCLWCNERSRQFYTLQAVQQHMQDKGHCKVLHEGEALFEYSDFYDYSSSYPDGSDANADEIYQPDLLQFNENMQLVLPSGTTLGHRALKIYYKQYVRPGNQVALRSNLKKKNVLSQYRAIGYGSTSLVEAQKRHKDQKAFKHIKDKWSMKLGIRGNKTLTKYFRNQSIQF